MKKKFTEKEFILNNQHFAFKLRNLYRKDEKLFYQISEYVPNSIHINSRYNLDYYYANNKMLSKGFEMEKLFNKGVDYIHEISCPILLKGSLERINRFNDYNDFDSICLNPQKVRVNNKMTYFFSNKLIIDDSKYLNVSNFMDDMGVIGNLISEIMEPIHKSEEVWQQFQSLTKQEKVIIKLLAKGKSNKEVSDILFVSSHTIHTHRRNIYQKLNINKTSQLVRFALALEII